MFNSKITTATRKIVYARDNRACVLCEDDRAIHVHHFIPRGCGGNNEHFNLVCLCPTCHRVAHGDYAYSFDFPFDKATAVDAILGYLMDFYGEDFTTGFCIEPPVIP